MATHTLVTPVLLEVETALLGLDGASLAPGAMRHLALRE